MKLSHLGKPSGNKGKKSSKETLKKLSLSHIGIKYTKERNQKISNTLKNRWNKQNHHMLGKILPEETKEKIRKWSMNNRDFLLKNAKKGHKSCLKISSIELKLQKEMRKSGIKFIPQKEYKLGFMDFLVNNHLAVFVDGNYWHNYPYGTEKDLRQSNWLLNNGYNVIRFWETEIKKDVKDCINQIKQVI